MVDVRVVEPGRHRDVVEALQMTAVGAFERMRLCAHHHAALRACRLRELIHATQRTSAMRRS